MMNDARNGKIDLIITKSVSRFARNTISTVNAIRELKALNVGVYFGNENMDSLDPKSEFMLTLLTSMAQEEARHTSESVNWTYQKKFREGKPVINTTRFLGLTKTEDGKIVINESEATIVREIFRLYNTGTGPTEICRIMEMRHYLTGAGKKEWHLSTIQGIIRNEKYVGDLVQQKTYTIDFLSNKRVKNKGNKTKYESKGVIPAIIDREIFELAQSIIEKRRKGQLDENETNAAKFLIRYTLSGKLICLKCGETLKRRYWNYGKPSQRTIMLCNGFIQGKKKCNSKGIVLDVIEEAIRDSISKFVDLVPVHHSDIKKDDDSEYLNLLDEVAVIKGNLEKLIERQLNARSDFERNALDKKYEEYSEILENKSVLLKKMQNKQKDISLEGDRIEVLNDFLDSNSKELTDEVVYAFFSRIIMVDFQHMVIVVAKDKSVTGEQITSNRKDIAQMNGVIEGNVEIRMGIKVYKMSYKVVVI